MSEQNNQPATAPAVASSDLLAAVRNEVRVLDKEIELMQLRVKEEPSRGELRAFGSCLWRHKRALEKAIEANTERSHGAENH